MKTDVQLILTRTKGDKLISEHRQPSRSYVLAMIDLFNAQAAQLTRTIKDTDGIDRSIPVFQGNWDIGAPAGTVLYGIVIGIGNTAVTIANYQLENRCAEGTLSGQFNCGAVSVGVPTTSGSVRKFSVVRNYTNNSTGYTIVRECGIYCEGASTPYYLCLIRDVLVTPQQVEIGQTLTVTYTIKVTV